ncbi:MAG: hypothetical protein VX498_04915 [Myxococcota bacterium]|nr:hypothetical protein [Myxococcota bacterium]
MLDSTKKISIPTFGVIALLAGSCVVELGPPDLGPCSLPPDGRVSWEYGEVGVGSCLASPSDLRVLPDPEDPSNYFLVVANSNSRSNFTGSSLLSIDGSSIDLACPVNGMHELQTDALEMREFVGRFDVDELSGLGLVTSRYSGGFEGDLTDAVFAVDFSDPRELQFSDAAPRQTGPFRWLRVPGDPWSVRINPWTGRAYVLSLMHHTGSALDLVSNPIEVVDLYGERVVGAAVFEDGDGSGSAPDFELIGVNESLLQDEVLTLTWQVGTTRLYYPVLDGDGRSVLQQADSGNGVDFHVLAGGPLLRPGAEWSAGGLGSAAVAAQEGALLGLVEGSTVLGGRSIGSMSSPDHAVNWELSESPVLSPSLADWDSAGVFHPDWIASGDELWVYYSGGSFLGESIGRAVGSDFTSLVRAGDPDLTHGSAGTVLEPEAGSFDGVAVFGPSVLVHGDTGEYLLFYSGHDDASSGPTPSGLAIGLARSGDGQSFERDAAGPVLLPGAVGSWDAEGVAFPSVFFDNGRFQMWYQGWDGTEWRTGRATSVDGRHWQKDSRNPVFDGVFDSAGRPTRAFAFKASPGGYYRLDGTASGDSLDYAVEGVAFQSALSPILFRVVGGQALGLGAADSYDSDGVLSPAAVSNGSLLYVGAQGAARRVALGGDLGAAAERIGAVSFAGVAGDLAGLNGSEPSLDPGEIAAGERATDLLVAAGTEFGIALASAPIAAEPSDWDRQLVAVSATAIVTNGEPGSFDLAGVSAPAFVLGVAGEDLLFYEGTDGQASAIGLVRSEDGLTWTREGTEPVLRRGAAGAWDDASVGSPTLVYDAGSELFHLWYVGSDGTSSRIGYATSPDGRDWTRHTDSLGVSVPVFDGSGLAFAQDGVGRPSVTQTDSGFEMWFEGITDGVHRLGRARSTDGITWIPVTNPTTAGDRFTLQTQRGDEDASSAIQLGDDSSHPRLIDGFIVHGAGASEMILSPDGRHAVVANKRSPFLIVLDLWDDSDGEYLDANHNDIEAVIRVTQAHGMVGMRDLEFGPDGDLWALLSPLVVPETSPPDEPSRFGTEGLLRIDWNRVVAEDVPSGLGWDDVVIGFLPTARGIEEDLGYETEVSVGPSSLAMTEDGRRAYVTNFNDNSLYIMDLSVGARGAVRKRVTGLDENPWEVVLSPDETLAFVAKSYGVLRDGAQHSTIQVVDVDETSPTFGEVLTRLSNIESRSDRACTP